MDNYTKPYLWGDKQVSLATLRVGSLDAPQLTVLQYYYPEIPWLGHNGLIWEVIKDKYPQVSVDVEGKALMTDLTIAFGSKMQLDIFGELYIPSTAGVQYESGSIPKIPAVPEHIEESLTKREKKMLNALVKTLSLKLTELLVKDTTKPPEFGDIALTNSEVMDIFEIYDESELARKYMLGRLKKALRSL